LQTNTFADHKSRGRNTRFRQRAFSGCRDRYGSYPNYLATGAKRRRRIAKTPEALNLHSLYLVVRSYDLVPHLQQGKESLVRFFDCNHCFAHVGHFTGYQLIDALVGSRLQLLNLLD
jgi:hypothetical protein